MNNPTPVIESPANTNRRAAIMLPLLLFVVCVFLYGHELTHSRGAAGDSFHHLINGIFVRDAALSPLIALRHPFDFWKHYYGFFPAVNIGYYPPGFSVMQAPVMLMLGVSFVSGQITVLLTAILFAFFSYTWFQLRFSRVWAACATAILISTPMLVLHGRDIMLEIPVLAFMMGAIWAFEKILLENKPTWRLSIAWASCTSIALMTKQHAILLILIFPCALIALRTFRPFFRVPTLLAGVVIAIFTAGLVGLTIKFGGTNVAHSVGLTKAHVLSRFNLHQWVYYLIGLPEIVGYPVLVASIIGLIAAIMRRDRLALLPLIWIVLFYGMHSYFVAQEWRYGCLWVPPFVALAVAGIRDIGRGLAAAAERKTSPVRCVVLAGLTAFSIYHGYLTPVPFISDAFERAAADLRDRMGQFSCLSFVPDKPGRLPVNFRVSLASRDDHHRSIYSYGRILRAGQLWNFSHERWTDAKALLACFDEWNVKYIALTRPAPFEEVLDEPQISRKLDEVLATGAFIEIGRYSMNNMDHKYSQRTLFLYERKDPMTFNPHAQIPIRTHRIQQDIAARQDSE